MTKTSVLLTWLAVIGWALAVFFYLHSKPATDPAQVKALQLQLHQDSVHTQAQLKLLHARDTVMQHYTDTVTRQIIHWQQLAGRVDTVKDTVLREVVRQGQVVAKACTDLQLSCQAYRQQASGTIDRLQGQYHHLDSMYKVMPKDHRWGLTFQLGEGLTLERYPQLRPVVTVGLGYRLF
jgi:hypothetical protein